MRGGEAWSVRLDSTTGKISAVGSAVPAMVWNAQLRELDNHEYLFRFSNGITSRAFRLRMRWAKSKDGRVTGQSPSHPLRCHLARTQPPPRWIDSLRSQQVVYWDEDGLNLCAIARENEEISLGVSEQEAKMYAWTLGTGGAIEYEPGLVIKGAKQITYNKTKKVFEVYM